MPKRRHTAIDGADSQVTGAPTQRRSRDASDVSSEASGGSGGEAIGDDTQNVSQNVLVQKLVRLAMASEYSRTPLRKADMSSKIMPSGSGRRFNVVLQEANNQLRDIFGMELIALPQKDRVTVSQKRAAARIGTQSQASASSVNKAYILSSILPAEYRKARVIPPSRIPTPAQEGAYYGFTTFVVGLIYLSAGSTISESRLEKALKRVNADEYVCGDNISDILKRMAREGYIVKIRERGQNGDETIDYLVGPRGKVEIGERGIADVTRIVYDKKDSEREELEKRLARSLGEDVAEATEVRTGNDADEGGASSNDENQLDTAARPRRSSRRD